MPTYGEKYKLTNGRFNPEALEEARRLKDQGLTDRQVAERMGASRTGIRTLAERAGVAYAPCKNKKWTQEEKELVRVLRGQGLTCGEIAGRFGVSRNVIIGVRNRMGLCDPKNITKPRPGDKRYRKRVKATPPRTPRPRKPSLPPIEPDDFVPLPDVEIAVHERKKILIVDETGRAHANKALTNECCRWPLGDPRGADFGFCGRQKTAGRSYCPHHAKRATTPFVIPPRKPVLPITAD
jgi:GcrA cell cycle regulator